MPSHNKQKNQNIKKIIIISLFTLIFGIGIFGINNNVLAQAVINSVDGTISDGGTVVIGGGGFGIKSPATPVLWDNFENGSVNPGWDKVTVPGWIVYNGAGQPAGSTYALRADRGRVNSVDLMKDHAFGNNLYVSLKRRWDFEIIDRNQKFFRIYDDTKRYSIAWNYLSESPIHRPEFFCKDEISPYVEDPGNVSVYSGVMPMTAYPEPGKWLAEEFFVKMPTVTDGCDGELGYRVGNSYEYFPQRCINTSVPGPWRYIYLDNFGSWYDHTVCEDSPDASYDKYDCLPLGSYIWVDDVYIDDTWSRVVLANNQNYDSATKIEIQPPTTWNNSQISINFNTGEFNTGDTVYLFVFDANNNHNQTGYPITIGETTSDTTPPTITNPQPTGTLPSGTTSTTLSITTNENATCKYSTIPNTTYNNITNTFTTTGTTTHSQTINNLTDGNTYNYYIRCQDTNNNSNTTDTTITFNISPTPITYNLSNFTSLVTNWLGIGDNNSDVNNDGIVNTRDLGIMMSGWE